MPVHNWSRVDIGAFHDFHSAWIAEIRKVLNRTILPAGYTARSEQHTKPFVGDVIALDINDRAPPGATSDGPVALVPPTARLMDTIDWASNRQRRIVIRHTSGRRIVAVIELISHGNKASRSKFTTFVRKAVRLIRLGVHVLVIDIQPRTARDPHGIHAPIWSRLGGTRLRTPRAEPFTVASYSASEPLRAFVEPLAVGRPLPPAPLFLEPELYVNVPLEATYQEAFDGSPEDVIARLSAGV